MNAMVTGAWVAVCATVFAACAVGVDEQEEPLLEQSVQAVGPEPCEGKLTCPEGKVAKKLPNCNEVCVPDREFECSANTDCPALHCVTAPCPQLVCQGHKCVLPGSSPAASVPCGSKVCGPTDYCCNASCSMCAPVGGSCIQMICADPG
jgi:hypothetical protein